MSVPITNATAIIYPVSQSPNGSNVAGNPAEGASVSVSVYFEEATPAQALMEYGLELRQPAFIQCEVSDAINFTSEAVVRIQIDGVTYSTGTYYREYVVKGIPEVHTVPGFTDADHADILLDWLEYGDS